MPDTLPAPPWAARFRGIRQLEVRRVADVTPQMRRITLGGAEFDGIPEGVNVKLLLPPRPGVALELPLRTAEGRPLWPEGDRKPVVRTYTARRIDRDAGEMDVDFVLHGDEGVASGWAARARPGDVIGVGGPGGRTVLPADWYLLAGDHTALPAISRILETLPGNVRGEALVEIPDRTEEQPLVHPPGMTLRWLHRNGAEAGTTTLLVDAVRAMIWPAEGRPFVWVGAESAAARAIRAHVRDTVGIDKRSMLVIGYWKRGVTETEYAATSDHDREKHTNDR